MSKVLTIKQAIIQSAKLRKEGKIIVLVGGCFDIVHIGHIRFLTQAKKRGDHLFILLESDQTVKKLKGKDHPIHNQKTRAEVLAAFYVTDSIVLLPPLTTNQEYDELAKSLKPAIIATTKGDPGRAHKIRQARGIGARVVDVITRLPHASSKLSQVLQKNYYL